MKGGMTKGGATKGGATKGGATKGSAMRRGAAKGGAINGGAMNGGAMNGGAMNGGAMNGGAAKGGATKGGATRRATSCGAMTHAGLLALLVSLACGGPETNGGASAAAHDQTVADESTAAESAADESTAAESAAEATPAGADARHADAPAGAEPIARLLRARHREDLPDRDALLAHPEPEASLRWLVEHGDPLVLRVRAASALRFFDGAETLALLRAVFTDAALPGNLRAAAIEGTARFPLDAPHRAELDALAADTDPRVARAARARLANASQPAASAPGPSAP